MKLFLFAFKFDLPYNKGGGFHMIKGLVLYDYDGTLVDERDGIYEVTAKTRKAISLLQDSGYLCVLATGRALSYIPQEAKNLHLDGYVTCNGAYATIHGKEIHKVIFDEMELGKLVAYAKKEDINFILEGNSFCYVQDMEDKEYLHFIENFKIPLDNFVQYKDINQVKDKISKITLICKNKDHLEEAAKQLENKYQICRHRNCNSFDLGYKQIHKGVGAKAIIDFYHIDYEKTYAFGDGDNDVELLRDVKYGIAMRKHDPKLDAVCCMVTGTVKEEGIYEALKKLEVI